MPPITPRNPSERRKKGGALVPIALGGAVLVGVVGWLWWRRRRLPPTPGAVLVASPGGPTII